MIVILTGCGNIIPPDPPSTEAQACVDNAHAWFIRCQGLIGEADKCYDMYDADIQYCKERFSL